MTSEPRRQPHQELLRRIDALLCNQTEAQLTQKAKVIVEQARYIADHDWRCSLILDLSSSFRRHKRLYLALFLALILVWMC